MFGLQIVDVALGLVFIYLTLALTCTATNETLATLLRLRSRTLRAGLHHLLNDPKFRHPDGDERGLEARFYDHPLIKSLYEGQAIPNGGVTSDTVVRARPSYIPGPTFAAAVLDIIAPAMENSVRTMSDIRQHVAALPQDCDLRRTLLVLMDEAGDDVTRLRQGIEAWFDQAMDRVSGWYKRRAHTLTLVCAVIVTLIINADTIRIAHVLASDPKELSGLLEQVEQFYEKHQAGLATPQTAAPTDTTALAAAPAPTAIDSQFNPVLDTLRIHAQHLNATIADLRNTGVPLGWKLAELPARWHGEENENWAIWLFRKLGGLLVTALAVSMGAPFWFDLLSKFMTVRGVGQRPGTTTRRTRPRSQVADAPHT